MGVNLSIKNTPEHIVAALRDRARRNHRSLQGELMAIVERAAAESGPADLQEVLARIRAVGVHHPSESAEIVRHMRDTRYGDESL
jgi:antitoxin FitA